MKRTGLVLKPLDLDVFNPRAGLLATTFDRVEILSERRFSCGNVQYMCRTDSGATFAASPSMVQPD